METSNEQIQSMAMTASEDACENKPKAEPKPGIHTPKEIADRYTFLDKLGEGTQGNVFRAERKSDGKIVAVKKLRIDSVNTWK